MEYIVVYIRLEEAPCKHRFISANIKKVRVSSNRSRVPNTIKEVPIIIIPKMTRLRRPMHAINFPTIGLTITTATEYIENIYPSHEESTPFFSNSNGKNGAMIA